MELITKVIKLKRKHTFTTARGSSTEKKNIILKIKQGGITGIAEVAPVYYKGDSCNSIISGINKMKKYLKNYSPANLLDIQKLTNEKIPDNYTAQSALDIACHDWYGKKNKLAVWKMYGLNKNINAKTSITIGICNPDIFKKRLEEFKTYEFIKIKLGGKYDMECLKLLKEHCSSKIAVDANEAWTLNKAVRMIKYLKTLKVEFVEQPLKRDRLAEYKKLKKLSDLPIFIDESLQTSEDLFKFYKYIDGINIKISKLRGISEAYALAKIAKHIGLKVMFGCFSESSCGISGIAQLASLADYLDLDANLLITDDPFIGVRTKKDGSMILSELPGIGVKKRN